MNFAGAFFGGDVLGPFAQKKRREKFTHRDPYMNVPQTRGAKGDMSLFFCFGHLLEKENIGHLFGDVFGRLFAYPPLPPHFRGRVTPAKLTNLNFGASRQNPNCKDLAVRIIVALFRQCLKSFSRSVIVVVPYMRTPLATTWSGSKSSLNRSPRLGVTRSPVSPGPPKI